MNKKTLAIVAALLLAIFVSTQISSAANLTAAVGTLSQNEEWSIMAYASVGQKVGTSYLKQALSSSAVATDYEKRILAISAQGENPKTFGSENFVTKLESMFDGNQIGETFLLNDDIFGILALKSAGVSGNIINKSREFILNNQNSDGGWGYGPTISSDSNTTAMAIAALSQTGGVPANAYTFVNSSKNSDGGFGYTAGHSSDGASTAWVILGLRSAGQTIPSNSLSFMESLQLSSGAFKWQPSDSTGSSLVTAYAVIALSGKSMPISFSGSTPTPPPPPAPNPPAPNPPPPSPSLSNNASCVSISAPTTVNPGQTFFVTATLRNTGSKTWGSLHRLGSQNPQDNLIWGLNRISLPFSVATNQNVTLTFNAIAPTPGNYSFQWRMLEESVEWFGQTCSINISVVTTTPTPVPPPAPLPPPPPPSSTGYTIKINHPNNIQYIETINFTSSSFIATNGQTYSYSSPTALGALLYALADTNMLYEIQQTSMGPYVRSINGYRASRTSGWLYAVNGSTPSVAASDYNLRNGDFVQWFWGGSGTNPY